MEPGVIYPSIIGLCVFFFLFLFLFPSVAYFGAQVMYNYSFYSRHDDIPQCIDESCINCVILSICVDLTRKIPVVFPGVVQDFGARGGAVLDGFASNPDYRPR